MLQRRQDLSASQVSLDLLDVLCRLLQAVNDEAGTPVIDHFWY